MVFYTKGQTICAGAAICKQNMNDHSSEKCQQRTKLPDYQQGLQSVSEHKLRRICFIMNIHACYVEPVNELTLYTNELDI